MTEAAGLAILIGTIALPVGLARIILGLLMAQLTRVRVAVPAATPPSPTREALPAPARTLS